MDDETLFCSLRELTELLRKHYEKQVIVLIDEYDVPLAKANELGYYDEMVRLIRGIFGSMGLPAGRKTVKLWWKVSHWCDRKPELRDRWQRSPGFCD